LRCLPRLFGTTLSNIPGGRGYLSPDTRRRAAWRERLGHRSPGTGPRIGLVWAGNPENTADWRRSIPLSRFTPPGAIEDDGDRSFVSPRVYVPESDRSAMAVLGVLDLSAELADFGETAAAIANLDLVVTVDSAVAHLSAALGVPTWILVYQPANWRWPIGRNDSPWYPSVRLFRQTHAGDWTEPLGRLLAEIAATF
jgi:hypothetical protein